MNTKLKALIRRSIDLHVHIGPELIPRKYTVQSLYTSERGKISGIALKNHFFATTSFIKEAKVRGLRLIGSVTLNTFVGGLNPDAVYAAATLASGPFIVWFPTVSARQFLKTSTWEIAPEWIGKTSIQARKAQDVRAIRILDAKGALKKDVREVLRAIQSSDAILATGHISWTESDTLVTQAVKMGIRRIVITHPIYQRIAMPVEIQKKLATMGAYIEQCYSMIRIDKIPVAAIARQIRAIGPKYCILSSDVGQTFSPSPSESLMKFASLLLAQGITFQELEMMLVDNPNRLIRV